MYDVNEDNILLLLLVFGVVAINLLLFNYDSRAPTQQLVNLDGFIFLPNTRVFFLSHVNMLQRRHNTKNSTHKNTFLIKHYIYGSFVVFVVSRPCAFGVTEGQR